MNKEVKEKWLEALRSGEYEQARSRLRRGEGYCCLGVLCDLAVKEGVIEQRQDDDEFTYRYGTPGEFDAYMGDRSTTPGSVQKWAGLAAGNPNVTVPEDVAIRVGLSLEDFELTQEGIAYSLAALNDEGGTFAEIADLIDAQL